MRRQKIIPQLATAAAVVLIGTAPILALRSSNTVSCRAAQPPIQETLATPDHFFDSNGVRIRYVDHGHGPPVVLIHGYTGNIERHWIATGVFANLMKDHRVIALDCRGHGKSGKPTDPKAYGAEMAQDIVRLLDHLKIRRAHVVGFSMGAMIGGRLLVTNASRLLTVTFVGHHPVRKWTTVDEQQAEASARELEGDLPFRSLILAISPPGVPPPSEDEIRTLSQRLIATNDLKALAAFHRGLRTLTVTDAQLAAVRVPALEVIGSADANLADAQELRKAMPALKLVVVDGATHGGERGILRRPELLAAFRSFVASNAIPGAHAATQTGGHGTTLFQSATPHPRIKAAAIFSRYGSDSIKYIYDQRYQNNGNYEYPEDNAVYRLAIKDTFSRLRLGF
jgi:pimeloyl-ACP methyl ester carboxylesterase